MKSLLVGNGVNIQFNAKDYTTQQIVLRILKNCDRDDFPKHIIIDSHYLIKIYIGQLFLESRKLIDGEYDKYANCLAERNSIVSFKEQYSSKIKTLKITDIGFEDYYLIHDLVSHKSNTKNPEQFSVRESLRMAYLFSIYNDGELNELHKLYSSSFKDYLKSFNVIFTTNYDSNIDLVVEKQVYHLHGSFDTLSAVYDVDSFRNKLPDAPIKDTVIDPQYYYLYSNVLTTHSGAYKEFLLTQSSLANSAIEKSALAYSENPKIKIEVDSWTNDKYTATANIAYAIKLKCKYPELSFKEDYHLDKLGETRGELDVLGLSPWNDFHLFETLDKSNIDLCTYYFYSDEQRKKIVELLPTLSMKGALRFVSVTEFWRGFA